jgi:hypothetical protein
MVFLFVYRYYSANGKMENCTFFSFLFFLREIAFVVVVVFVVVPLRP